MPNNFLIKYILQTLVYYDVMDYPMTAFEVWKYLTRTSQQSIDNIQQQIEIGAQCMIEKYGLTEVIKELESDGLKKYIEEYQGYYFLQGRKNLVEQRLERNKIAEKKFKLIQKITGWLRFLPYIKMVAVTGRVAMKNSENKSDLDFLIVLKKHKLFTGRMLVTSLIHFLGRRRYADKIKNRACLNYYITDKSLEISLRDVFSASEYFFITPIFGKDIFHEFQEKNSWIGGYKPNYSPDKIFNLKFVRDNKLAKFSRRLLKGLLEFF